MVVGNNHKFDAAVLPAKLVNTALFLGTTRVDTMVSREHMQQSKEFTTGRVCARIF